MNDEGQESRGTGSGRGTPDLLEQVYETLHGLAAHYLRGEWAGHTLQPTALVHEAFIKLSKNDGTTGWQSETHFRVAAAGAMRRILVDHARGRDAIKRGGRQWSRVTLTPDVAVTDESDVDLLVLDEAMLALEELDERKSQVVELRFFGGLTNPEVASHLDVSLTTVESDWYFARAWLRKRLGRAEQ